MQIKSAVASIKDSGDGPLDEELDEITKVCAYWLTCILVTGQHRTLMSKSWIQLISWSGTTWMCLQQAGQWRKVCFMLHEFAVCCIVRI